jgi:hypothetical protein
MKILDGALNALYFLLANAVSNEENHNAQTPKRGDPRDFSTNPNVQSEGIRDETATTGGGLPPKGDEPQGKRTRSRNSSTTRDAKYDSATKLSTGKEILSSERVHKVLNSQLEQYIEANGKYNGLVRIMKAGFLVTCYSLIKSKPGNMTPSHNQETLDRINNNWFEITAKNILTGKFRFTPARQVLIPKPGKSDRKLLIANPREKIVQKAVQMILEAIFEPTFSESSYGFRRGRSIKSALDQIHLKGGQRA